MLIFAKTEGLDASLMYAAVANGAKGNIILGSGAGAISPSAREAATDLFSSGIPTVISARPVTGTGMPAIREGPVIQSNYVNGHGARIMMHLAINAGMSLDEIRDLFEEPLRKAIYDNPAN